MHSSSQHFLLSCPPVFFFHATIHGPNYCVLPRKQHTFFPQDTLFPSKWAVRRSVKNSAQYEDFSSPRSFRATTCEASVPSERLSDTRALSPVGLMCSSHYLRNMFPFSPSHRHPKNDVYHSSVSSPVPEHWEQATIL